MQLTEDPRAAATADRLPLKSIDIGANDTTVTVRGSATQIANFQEELFKTNSGAFYNPGLVEATIVLAPPDKFDTADLEQRDIIRARAYREVEAIEVSLYMAMGREKAEQEGRVLKVEANLEAGFVVTIVNYPTSIWAIRYLLSDRTQSGTQISGRVLDENGRPVRDALVSMRFPSEASVRTDRQGRYRFSGFYDMAIAYFHDVVPNQVVIRAEDMRPDSPYPEQTVHLPLKAGAQMTRDIVLQRGRKA